MEPILTIRPPIKLSSTLVDKIIFFIPVASEIDDTTFFCCFWSSANDDVTSALTSPLILDTSDKKSSITSLIKINLPWKNHYVYHRKKNY